MDHSTEVTSEGKGPNSSDKQTTVSKEEIQIIFEDKFCEFELSIKNRLDDLERGIGKNDDACFKLQEQIISETGVKSNSTRIGGREDKVKETPTLHTSYIIGLLGQNRLPGWRDDPEGRTSMHHNLFWMFIHTAALCISILFILGAYHGWKSSPIVQSLMYTHVKDIPFPAITVCEPLLLKEGFKRFEVLKRCVSLENETWLCSEEELDMLRISNDIYRIEFDLIPMNESDRNVMRKLLSRVFDHLGKYFPSDSNHTFSGTEYLKYVDKLGKRRKNSFRIDFPDSPSLTDSLRNGASDPIFMAHWNGIHACQTFNSIFSGPQERKIRKVSKYNLKNSSNCNPTDMIEYVCKDDLIFTHLDVRIQFEYADIIDSIGPGVGNFSSKIQSLYFAREFYKVFLVFIHNSFTRPSIMNINYERIIRHTATVATVTPTFTNSRKDLVEVDVSARNCIFSFERQLSLFKTYTQTNCFLECQINCTLAVCGCVPYSVAIFNSSFSFCGKKRSDECLSSNDFIFWLILGDERCTCDCLPDCVSMTYDITTAPDMFATGEKTTYRILYENPEIRSTLRYSESSLTTSEFVAYSLGILGVFNGFSMILVWKILYRLTIGLWCAVRNR